MNKPRSSTLFHFTKSIDSLKGILPKYSLEDMSWIFGLDQHIAHTMICFCDIPLARISEHTQFYGKYGIGMTRDWGEKNNLQPLVYYTSTGTLKASLNYFFLRKFLKDKDPKIGEYNENFWQIMALAKPVRSTMIVSGSPVEKEFYQESEWRYISNEIDIIVEKDYELKKEKANKEVEKYALKINPADIKYLFVENESDIPPLVDFILNDLGELPYNDLKILLSRIISTTSISSDI